VVELAHVAAGPFTGMLLADLGADVVKVEPPAGDQMRAWPPFAVRTGGPGDGGDGEELFSHNFASVNRNKRSVVADLKDPEQLARVRELVEHADVVVENYRPGVLDRLGLGYDEVTQGHRGLVYCSISGYGLGSPYLNDGAYDVVIQGMSGLMSVTGEPAEEGGRPVKAGVPVGDFTAGLYAAYTVAALLPQVRDSGRSVRLDVPMLDCLLGVSALQTSEYWGSGREPQRLGTAHPRNAPYQGFSAADGDFTVAAGNDRLWRAVADVVGLSDLADDPRFATQLDRVSHQKELETLLQDRFSGEKREHWIAELKARGVPCGPVNTFGEILADPAVEASGLVQELAIPVAGPTPTVIYPVRIGGLDARLDRGAPVLGADPEVYDEWAGR
jgi:succinate---hydroxymethylglutarate CoA-transferase